MPTFDYATHVLRNSGYIRPDVQSALKDLPLLIAGCGIGSGVAVAAARMGMTKFILVDGDRVDAHNLNRQFYDFADIGRLKVDALKDQILRINPEAQVDAIAEYLNPVNTPPIVARAKFVFDTVDFLDFEAVVSLHESARVLRVPLLTALNAGFGTLSWYFPPDTEHSLLKVLAPDIESAAKAAGGMPSYALIFRSFIKRLVPLLDVEVVDQVQGVIDLMAEGKACPASQVIGGSMATAAMAVTLIREIISGNKVPASPDVIIQSYHTLRTIVMPVPAFVE